MQFKLSCNLQKINMSKCYQYIRKEQTFEGDKLFWENRGVDISDIVLDDFEMKMEEKDEVFSEVKRFIERYEWLGKMSNYPTHICTARFDGVLGGVVIMDMPTAFSKLLGDDTKKLERLISRGASASWTPKNLASKQLMYMIRHMVDTTPYRLFTAYSDPSAHELGTIYQACNFFYLGQSFGTRIQYRYKEKWVSDRYFRSRSFYKRVAKRLNITWDSEWQTRDRVHFNKMPKSITTKIKETAKKIMKECDNRKPPQKHKYAYVLGRDKSETKELRNRFKKRNKIFEYPKHR